MPQTGIPPRAFTLTADGRLGVIELELRITGPDRSEPAVRAKSLWSTSDVRTRLSQTVIDALGLEVQQNEQGDWLCTADIHLPNNIRCAGVQALVSAQPMAGGRDCVVGLDIISLGDLSLSYAGGKTVFSFRAPAAGGTDFVAEQDAAAATAAATEPELKSGARPRAAHVVPATRDQLCPCGSGKKHKNCCGKMNRATRRGRKNKPRS